MMCPAEHGPGEIVRSRPEAWAANRRVSIPLDFLSPGLGGFVDRFWFRYEGFSLTAAAGTAFLGEDMYRAIARAVLTDGCDPILDVEGMSLREIAIADIGDGHHDPADIAKGVVAAARTYTAAVLFSDETHGAQDEDDCALPITQKLIDSGRLNITFSAADPVGVGHIVVSGTLVVLAQIRRTHGTKTPSRKKWFEQDVTRRDDSYEIGGRLRCATIYERAVAAAGAGGYTDIGLVLTTTTSEGLGYSELATDEMREIANTHARGAFEQNPSPWVTSLDVTNTPLAIGLPLKHARVREQIGRMPMLDRLHIRFNAAPTAGITRMLACVIDRRSAEYASEVVASQGGGGGQAVVLGAEKVAAALSPDLRSTLPMEIVTPASLARPGPA